MWGKRGEQTNEATERGAGTRSAEESGTFYPLGDVHVNSAFHTSGVGKSSTSLSGWG